MTKYNIDDVIDNALLGWGDTAQHGITLLALVCSVNAKKILELGVRGGGTTYPLLKAASITNSVLTSVDIADAGYRPPSDLFPYWNFVVQDAIEFLTNTTESYDIIFVDDLHTTDHLYNELKLIDKISTKKTLILLHDLMWGGSHPEYNTAVMTHGEFEGTGPHGGLMKFLSEYPDYEYATIPINHGLTLLRKTK
jgi:predicted O-methyltransferase YrrM